MKTYNEIKTVVDSQELNAYFEKPEIITDQEYRYYLAVNKLEREVESLRVELGRKEKELDIMINDPDWFRYNEGI